jgi:hypothetical protein
MRSDNVLDMDTTPTAATAPQWRVTTDRNGNRAYCLATGQVVCKDGTGTTPVTVYYAGFRDWSYDGRQAGVGMTNTVREAKAWAEADDRG